MEDYRLEQSGQEVQNILNGAAMQVDLTAETERATEAEQVLDGKIDTEKGRIDALEEKIPSGASSSNKLATEEYVDDSVATATATFRGTFNLVSDLNLTVDATEQQIATALAGAISTADNNDYAFVQIPTSDETPTEIAEIDRYKFNGMAWAFEYALNNSGFTAAEWAAINSGITSELVTKLGNLPTAAALAEALASKQNVLTFDSVPTEGSNNPVKSDGVYSAIDDEKTAREGADSSLSAAIEAILLLIPSAATSLNKLADKAFVNSSIATNTATFRGTFNLVSDLHLTLAATHAEIGTALASAISDEDNNDYCFVQIPTSATSPTEIAQTDRYKFNGSIWEYEYTLNNSGFTSAQWTAINSGITTALVSKLSALPTNSELTTDLGTLTSAITAINQKIPAAAAQNNKLVDTAALESYIVQVLDVLTVSYNITSTDGHVTLAIQQTNGKITSVALTTSDIASAAALNLKASQADLTALASRVTTAEGNISTLGGRVSTNETDIANLQQLYNDLQQSKPVPVTALPSTDQQQGVIYRLAGTTSYSDYMWNGSTWVLMATYNNAIDPRPKKASQNLVTSGGVFDNMGALDISELNATENPHALATYADLSAALAAIPSNDYKKGGMSIKFVQSSDNNSIHKYVQYMCKTSTWSSTPTDWEKVNNVSVSQNTETGNKELLIGGQAELIVENVLDTSSNETISNKAASIPIFNLLGLPQNNIALNASYIKTSNNTITASSYYNIKYYYLKAGVYNVNFNISGVGSDDFAVGYTSSVPERGSVVSNVHIFAVSELSVGNNLYRYTLQNDGYLVFSYLIQILVSVSINTDSIYQYIDNASGIITTNDIRNQLSSVNNIYPDYNKLISLNGYKVRYIAANRGEKFIINANGIFTTFESASTPASNVTIANLQNNYVKGDVKMSVVTMEADGYMCISSANSVNVQVSRITKDISYYPDLMCEKTATSFIIFRHLSSMYYYKCTLQLRQKSYTSGEYPSNYDNWGITDISRCILYNGVFYDGATYINTGSEFEMALSLYYNSSYVFVGGQQHGCEKINVVNSARQIVFCVDNKFLNEDSLLPLTEANEAYIIQSSSIYAPYTEADKKGDATKKWIFNKSGIHIEAAFKASVSLDVGRIYIGMLGVFRRNLGSNGYLYLTSKANKDNMPFTIYNIENNWSISDLSNIDTNCFKITEYGDYPEGFSMEVTDRDRLASGGCFVSTNGAAYNKIYNCAGTGIEMIANQTIKSEVLMNIL